MTSRRSFFRQALGLILAPTAVAAAKPKLEEQILRNGWSRQHFMGVQWNITMPVGRLRVYNRAMTPAEVKQNYYVFASAYGLRNPKEGKETNG
jgi:hypothetical protein